MRRGLHWIIFAVYAICLTVFGRMGLQHTHFLFFLVALFGLTFVVLWALSHWQDKKGESAGGRRPVGDPSRE
jgi:hypothetical protein